MRLNMRPYEVTILLFALSMMLLLIVATEGPPVGPAFGIGWIALLVISRLEKKRDEQKSGGIIKVKITRIGTITEDGIVMDWTFDGSGFGPQPIALVIDRNLIGGYTIKELREIIQLNHKLEQLTEGGIAK